jgi:hypothetical protein
VSDVWRAPDRWVWVHAMSQSPFYKHVEELLQQHVEEVLAKAVPLPMTRESAIEQALRLRAEGMSYGNISKVMRLYHGRSVSPDHWSRLCREAGAPRKAPSGRAQENSGKRWP